MPETQTRLSEVLTYAHMLICTHTRQIPDKTQMIIEASFSPSHMHKPTPSPDFVTNNYAYMFSGLWVQLSLQRWDSKLDLLWTARLHYY